MTDRVKTAHLPDGRPCAHIRHRLFGVLIAGVLCAAALPAMASNPASTSPDPSTALAPATSANASLKVLSSPASIATPDAPAPMLQAQQPALSVEAPTTVTRIKSVLQNAFSLLGTPYRWGGTTPEGGFDCSGLVGYVFRTIGIDLPRVSRAMAQEGTKVVSRDALNEGDLVFFGHRGHVDHVGIYIGNGQFLHAPRTGRDVTVSNLTTGYWSKKFLEARRLIGTSQNS